MKPISALGAMTLKIIKENEELMKWQDLFQISGADLLLIYGRRNTKLSKFLQTASSEEETILVIDIHHNWSSHLIRDSTRVLQPLNLDELLDVINSLQLYVGPHLKYIIVDNLPLYFRDFRDSDQISTQNQRLYGFSLSVLKHLSHQVKILITSYSQGMDVSKPLMDDISKYYCDDIVQAFLKSSAIVFKSKKNNWELQASGL